MTQSNLTNIKIQELEEINFKLFEQIKSDKELRIKAEEEMAMLIRNLKEKIQFKK